MLPVLADVGPGFDVGTAPADPVSRIAGTVADCGLKDAYAEGSTKPNFSYRWPFHRSYPQ